MSTALRPNSKLADRVLELLHDASEASPRLDALNHRLDDRRQLRAKSSAKYASTYRHPNKLDDGREFFKKRADVHAVKKQISAVQPNRFVKPLGTI